MFDVLDELEGALDKVAADDPPVDVARLRRLVDRAEFLRIRAARASERAGEWQADGSVSARISRVITDGRSLPLDVGRATRTVAAAPWRALVVRDGGCTHPGCDRPPGWCEAHHVKHWADGGTTTLDSLKLYCDRHHHDAHQRPRTTRTRPARPQRRMT
ncbi:MAG TPA: HNH endonuclease signature motif containing protein [Acidimicrobiia bacterium]|jgi:hypothetical protein